MENGTCVNLEGRLNVRVLRAIQGATGKFKRISVDSLKVSGHRVLCIGKDGADFSSDTNEFLTIVALDSVIGIPLNLAIMKGYTPYFDGDIVPTGQASALLATGKYYDMILGPSVPPSNMIAYRLTAIESTILAAKVGFLDVSVEDFSLMKAVRHDIKLLKAKESNLPFLKDLIEELGL